MYRLQWRADTVQCVMIVIRLLVGWRSSRSCRQILILFSALYHTCSLCVNSSSVYIAQTDALSSAGAIVDRVMFLHLKTHIPLRVGSCKPIGHVINLPRGCGTFFHLHFPITVIISFPGFMNQFAIKFTASVYFDICGCLLSARNGQIISNLHLILSIVH